MRLKIWIAWLMMVLFSTYWAGMDSQIMAFDKNQGSKVFVNQVGYLPDMPKLVISSQRATEFYLVNLQNSSVMYKGKLTALYDPTSRMTVWRGVFSQFLTHGNYRIEVPGVGYSYPFIIKSDLYNDLLEISLRSYYFQRCGTEVSDPGIGLSHPACHTDDGVLARSDEFRKAGERINSVGGWHDAGDYGKYTATTAVTVAQLLVAYELWPNKFSDGQLHIPESGNGFPDILDEVRIGLKWLMTMQRADGAVYHKLAGKNWAIFDRPDHDIIKRYIYGISTADTGKFTAAAAIAARVFKTCDPAFATEAKQAAEKAWQFLCTHPLTWDHKGEDDTGSGAYGASDDRMDRLWAALELSVLSKENQPIKEFQTNDYRTEPSPISWNNASLLGLFDYIRSPFADPELKKMYTAKLAAAAERDVQTAKTSGYDYTLSYNQFLWASNKEGLSRGITMILADIADKDTHPEYRKFALSQLNFILGLNPLSKCFVSGTGSNAVTKPHHRWCDSAMKPIPGLLAGGPNNNAESGVEPYGKGPFSYMDETASYSSNEPAIDYNAALVFLTSAFARSSSL